MKTILFVDDHELLARLSCEILEMQGYNAVSAYSAKDALEKFQKQKIDLIVSDFRMDDMNGLELAKQVHTTNPEIPVIIITGYGPLEVGKEATECLQKQEMLFPALLDKIKVYLEDAPRHAA